MAQDLRSNRNRNNSILTSSCNAKGPDKAYLLTVSAFLGTLSIAAAVLDIQPGQPFIYVYDMPPRFTTDIADLEMPPDSTWTHWYTEDQYIHESLLVSPHRTQDPCEASLFFIPVYAGRFHAWHIANRPAAAWEGTPAVADLVAEALVYVKEQLLGWNASGGQDHFLVMPTDRGRCDLLRPGVLEPEWGHQLNQLGRTFFLLVDGDLNTRGPANDQWPCYRPSHDVLIPYPLEPYQALLDDVEATPDNLRGTWTGLGTPGVAQIVSPFATNRTITALYRFERARHAKGVTFGHYERDELHDELERDPLPGSDARLENIVETHWSMEHAVFCVCPGGHTQNTVRHYRAIVSGCIPVVFTHAYHLPFAQRLRLDWDAFSVRIEPDDIERSTEILTQALADRPRLRQLQQGLERAAPLFVYGPVEDQDQGVVNTVVKELWLIAEQLPLFNNCPDGSGGSGSVEGHGPGQHRGARGAAGGQGEWESRSREGQARKLGHHRA